MKIIDVKPRVAQILTSKKRTWSKKLWIGLLSVVLLSGVGTTVSFFTDLEFSPGNIFAAVLLDFDLEGTPWLPASDAADLDPGDEISRNVDVVDDDSTEFSYKVKPEMTGGDAPFCGALNVRANLEGSEVYSGNLLAFESSPVQFGSAGDNWTFSVTVPSAFGSSTCVFDFVFQAWQSTPFIFPGGFWDVERIGNVISTQEVCREFEIRSRGYWKNHEEDWILPQTVGVILISTPEEAEDMLNAHADMTDKLERELLALKFNASSTPGIASSLVPDEDIIISELIAEADALLIADFPDPDPVPNQQLKDMKDRVEKVNNAKKVSPCENPPPPDDDCDDEDDEDDRDHHGHEGYGGSTSLTAGGGGDHGDGDDDHDGDSCRCENRLRVTRVEAGGTVMIMTGDACAEAEVENVVNTSVTEISGGGEGNVIVENNNNAVVENEINVEANTGGNSAESLESPPAPEAPPDEPSPVD
ncbi:hypothetical protein A3H04_01855 [Candidatus Giovannonibacteria bacterium RIFCSPLOWO2_12_FULL_43_11c]|uniref:Uncharacterized protein n=1 Tax=Candidatus Giovannonibacteria bacterium RIFCSPHIGHO2_12_FULL_43_15 TaxID=1798341 RepID=A0A1F5WNA5_9BACT|nr:MAG: hypothetical protein A3F23_00050 [Candidatus Giovannonibacteria bacterium RIFCSPHIGHO2_12_FULL_43_15]OGF91506.1 MAG: hypothetical protein A3H04_01855 [Candidatus Giovannonibacteria bacterium RIFCSPLOWO2_12_FULL_43_11c]